SKLAGRWTPGELFWIIRHGLKYTGMPGWPVPARDDEVWAVVAVVLRLPEIDAETYTRLALASYVNAAGPEDRVLAGFLEGDPIACIRCHGTPRAGGSSGGVPKLAGQRPEYLEMTLRDYEFGTRPSGIMHPVAIYLTKDDRQQLARYFASLATPEPAVRPSAAVAALSDGTAARTGGMLAAFGAPVRGIPACSACHGENGRAEGMDARFPALAGQHFGYLVNQLELWRAGIRGGTFDKLMSAAARYLTDEDITAVAAYYSSLGRNSN
ncbi:MAG: c-type cytochrome, partial [Gammaproteobacteria bacterium]